MSNYPKHLLTGLIVTCLVSLIAAYYNLLTFTPVNILWLAAISFVFALLPDIDIGTSLIRKLAIVAFVAFILINGINTLGYIVGAIVIILQFIPHRGIMHSIIMGALLSGLLYFYFHAWAFPIIAFLNFISHLVLDQF